MAENLERDPVTSQSLAPWLLISSLLLIASLGWALYDEIYGLRPWKSYQARFARLYSSFLEKKIPEQRAREEEIKASPEYQALERKLRDLEAEAAPRREELNERLRRINRRLSVVTASYTDARARIGAMTYQAEHASSSRARQGILEDIEALKQRTRSLRLARLEDAAAAEAEDVRFDYNQLEEEFIRLQRLRSEVQAEQAALERPVSELRQQVEAHLRNRLGGLTAGQLEGLLVKARTSPVEIRQLHNEDANLVDRCESCHLGIREPLVLTKADLGGEAAFTSHPVPELLAIHNPEIFGCTPCHNGNGMQVQSVRKAHGLYKHWLWPLHPRENMEAGCQQCHARDIHLEKAPVLSQGKYLFQYRGCMGCHGFRGYDPEPEELVNVQQSIRQLEADRGQAQRDIQRSIEAGDAAPDDETARRLYARADALRVEISKIDARVESLDRRARDLMREMKKVGPNLKDVRVKLPPEWLPVWIKSPHGWRPSTRMPEFRVSDGEVKAIAAFIWQSGIEARLPSHPRGDPVRGKESFETRGCLGCHSIGEGDQRMGGTFAANLTRIGEKTNYEYLVRWIHNPRERTAPYCPHEKRDLTPEDYKKHGLPYVFDEENSRCPNDGHELQVQNMTIMPSLRLSWEESRDIAAYLMTQRKPEASYEPAPFLNDPNLRDQGLRLVRRYGCAGCHEIAGMETEGRIGTELTEEGSKPIDQIDFAMFKTVAKREGWFNHKGFFERKLRKPDLFEQGLIRRPEERLIMPDLKLRDEEITALTTFLMGAVHSEVPERYHYLPEDQRRDVQEGWWVIKKYNCEGCHQFRMEQPSALQQLPRYQTPEGKDQLPPRLLSVGARTAPDWLARFLANPAMHERDLDRNGVRPYLRVRMPTFHLSPGEVQKLVRFFQARDRQPLPYIPPRLDPLTDRELLLARALFTSRAAPCLRCHATGDPGHDRFATAPNFLLGRDRLKAGWTKRWLLDPAMIDPGTAMPSGLFRRDGDRWVFAGPVPPIFQGYEKDHADLLVRYMFQITPEEQRRLIGMGGAQRAQSPPTPSPRAGAAYPKAGLQGMILKSH